MAAGNEFGVVGMGVMGRNLALNLADHGVQVLAWDRDPGHLAQAISVGGHAGLRGEADLEAFVKALPTPRRILLMVTAGAPVDAMIDRLLPLLVQGDVLIDGGNSWFEDTQVREARCLAKGVRFVGMGVSGGEEGARHGPSLMPGGSSEAWTLLRAQLEAIAAKTDAGPCVTHVGPGGAGHFVKMVHNGIEYADMQLLAEAYDLLRRGLGLDAPRLAAIFERWNAGPAESFLVEITARVLRKVDPETGRPLIDLVLDKAGQKGTGRWTVQAALELGVPVPSISAALDARVLSSMKDERVVASALLPEPQPGLVPAPPPDFEQRVHDAVYAARIATYAQGLRLIQAAGERHGWDVSLDELTRIWRGGCIIRAKLLVPLREALQRTPNAKNVLLDPAIAALLRASEPGLRNTLADAVRLGIPTPVLGASLAYYDSYRTADLPQNLTQAQRDAFGAHTYQRKDDPGRGFVHSEW